MATIEYITVSNYNRAVSFRDGVAKNCVAVSHLPPLVIKDEMIIPLPSYASDSIGPIDVIGKTEKQIYEAVKSFWKKRNDIIATKNALHIIVSLFYERYPLRNYHFAEVGGELVNDEMIVRFDNNVDGRTIHANLYEINEGKVGLRLVINNTKK